MKFEELRDLIVETLGCDADQVTPEASLTADFSYIKLKNLNFSCNFHCVCNDFVEAVCF